MIWSILICGIPERYATVQPLLYSLLERQAVARIPDIELLYLMDSRRRPVGAKRNALVDAARGMYISFIDDDDEVAEDYVKRIYGALRAARKNDIYPDVITFRQLAHLPQQQMIHDCSYSLEHFRNRPPEARRQLARLVDDTGKPVMDRLAWTGPPAHTMLWKADLANGVRFPERTFGEDTAWVDAMCAKAQSEYDLGGDPLYHYRFNELTSATRG